MEILEFIFLALFSSTFFIYPDVINQLVVLLLPICLWNIEWMNKWWMDGWNLSLIVFPSATDRDKYSTTWVLPTENIFTGALNWTDLALNLLPSTPAWTTLSYSLTINNCSLYIIVLSYVLFCLRNRLTLFIKPESVKNLQITFLL